MASVSLAFLALMFVEFRMIFGVLAAVTAIFFWIGYRIGKIKHAIDIRYAVILSFNIFLYLVMAFIVMISALGIPSYLESLGVYSDLLSVAVQGLVMGCGMAALWKLRKPAILAQDSLRDWLFADAVRTITQNDTDLKNTLDEAFRVSVQGAQYLAYTAGFLVFFVFFVESFVAFILNIGLNILGVLHFIISDSDFRKVEDQLLNLKEDPDFKPSKT